jgi:hypothetical protein
LGEGVAGLASFCHFGEKPFFFHGKTVLAKIVFVRWKKHLGKNCFCQMKKNYFLHEIDLVIKCKNCNVKKQLVNCMLNTKFFIASLPRLYGMHQKNVNSL